MSKQAVDTRRFPNEVAEINGTLEVEIRREVYSGKSTIGRLFVNGEFECYTLEDRARAQGEKVAGSTCIPAGSYGVSINYSRRFRRLLPQLLEVPSFEGIRIHPGNTEADTEGCILVGQTQGEDFVGNSRVAFRKLFAKLQAAEAAGATIRLQVVDQRAGKPADVPEGMPLKLETVRIKSMQVERWNPERDGSFSEQGLRRKLEKLGYHVARYTYAPGTVFPTHTHSEEKMDAVISGRFRIRMGEEETVLEAGDAVRVPRGAAHSAEVVGQEPVVSLDGVKAD